MNKFIDYYDLLLISPDADKEIIERVFRVMAKRYHPDNANTSDRDKFDLISEAHETLSDPGKRAAYDAGYDEHKTVQWQKYYQSTTTDGIEDETQIRFGILSALYQERKHNPSEPGVGQWQLEKLMGWPEKVLAFHIWYLRGKNWIERMEDDGTLAITPDGVDTFENSEFHIGRDRMLPAPEDVREDDT
jgi:curved DNA-binding protein